MNTASGVFFTWFLGLVFVAGGIVFMVFLDVNNLLYGLPYLVMGALLCYGAWRLQVSAKKKAAAEQAGSAEPPPAA
ncbi:MAG: hypothetical protein NT143_06490 [Actinobacteria bacterium]|nr:hypothetical protein [Actinomycetota bacterium]